MITSFRSRVLGFLTFALFLLLVQPLTAKTAPTPQPTANSDDRTKDPTPDDYSKMMPWYDRVTLSGFINAGYVKTGGNGAEYNGHFYAGERFFGANLFIDATIDEGIAAHNELFFYNQVVDLKEMVILFKDPLKNGGLVNLKVGRMDIPFGDEYNWQFPLDNWMILRTAEWPWGFSQGVEVFGHSGPAKWILSVMDGLGGSGFPLDHDDDMGKMVNAKFDLNPAEGLHLSVSGMDSGRHATSPLFLNDVNITAVAGSPSTMVAYQAWEADARIKLDAVQVRGDIGQLYLNDVEPYSRTLTYYYGEAKVNITREFYLVGRYSAIGTFDSQKGYQFGGDYDEGPDFGFDLKSMTRYGFGAGYWIGADTVLKAEVDQDSLALIDPAVGVDPDPGTDRYTFATEVAVKF